MQGFPQRSPWVPWPDEWTGALQLRSVFSMLFLVCLGTACVAVPVLDWVLGDPDLRTPVLLLVAPAAFAMACHGWATRVRLQGRSVEGVHLGEVGDLSLGTPQEWAVVIPNQQALAVIRRVFFGSCAVLLTVLAVAVVVALSDGPSIGPAIAGVAVSAFGIVVARALLEERRGRVVVGWLALAPSGIHYCAPGHDAYLPWEDAQSIWLTENAGDLLMVVRAQSSWRAVFRQRRRFDGHMFGLRPDLAVVGGLLSVNPALAYHAMHHYLTHEEARSELLDESGVERVCSGRFPTSEAGPI